MYRRPALPSLATGKINLLEHPVIETFFELKWWKIWKVYSLFMVLFLCHSLTVCGYALMEFGHVCSHQRRVSFLNLWMSMCAHNWYLLRKDLVRAEGKCRHY
jgi:hypothetical protein